MNLLIVNDAVLTADAMQKEINWEQYGINECYTAYNVLEAQRQISNHIIDIILCDIEMPGQNGLALIRWIREQNMNIECILLTCHADFEYAREAVTLGCQDYLLVPASYEDIGATVQKVVKRCVEKNDQQKLVQYGRSWLHDQETSVTEFSENAKSPKQVVEECVDYIMKNLKNEELSVNEIAAHCFLNPIYLNRIFKKEKDISISQFIIREKMTLAAKLLENPASQAAAVARQVGYPNYSYFSLTFKKYYGCTPAQYHESIVK